MTDSTPRTNRNKSSAKMLLTISPVTQPAVNTEQLTSPIGDPQDENSNKLIAYLHRLAGNHEVEADIILKDHNYAKAWNWKPDNVFVRPAKKIFFSKTQKAVTKEKIDDLIDVEGLEEEPPVPPVDMSKVCQTMEEFQRVSHFIRNEDVDDWEEKIDKILWSPVQNRIFNRVVRILNQERVARLTKEKSLHEPILRRTSIDSTAKKFRETLASAHWDWRITQWLHSLLFDHLPQDYLTIYLDVLQSLRQKIPQLIDKMINVQPSINSKSNAVTWETLGPLLKKSWDPLSSLLNACKPKKLPGNPILVVIHNGMSSSLTSRQQKWITQLGMLGTVITVPASTGLNVNRMTTVLNSLEQTIQAARTKIQDVKVEYPGKPVVLIGFNTGAGIACQVGLSEQVTAIVCLGFPHSTVDGKRGSSDDLMLDLHCPVMFVIGENASVSRIDEIEGMRERMLIPTSLVVVGSADDQLRISTSKKITERLSQSIVDRCILDEIGDFVGGVLTQPSPVPVRTINSHPPYENKTKRTNNSRKRKNSTSSCSLDSEPQSPCLKKGRPRSPSQAAHAINSNNNSNNNMSSISANALPRGTLVTLTGTTATQTPKSRKARVNFQNFSDQQASPRLNSQNVDNSMGGITLNIGSLASLSPVGPIRFESTPISLQVSPAGTKAVGGTIKTSANTFIKVPKGSHQVNVANPAVQNVGKIKMLMPTKKATTPRTNASQKNANAMEKAGDTARANVLLPSNQVPAKIGTQTTATPNAKASTGSASNLGPLPSLQPTKSVANSATTVASPTFSTSLTPSKVADSSSNIGCRRQVQISGSAKPRTAQTSRAKNPPAVSSSPPKSSLSNQLAKQAPHTPVQSVSSKVQTATTTTTTDKNAAKTNTESTDTSRHHHHHHHQQHHQSSKPTPTATSKNHQRDPNQFSTSTSSTSLDDGLENILDIPIIIAKDGENLNNLGCSLSALPSTNIQQPEHTRATQLQPPTLQVCSNKVFFINSSRVQPTLIQPQSSGTNSNSRAAIKPTAAQTQIKYTKIILTKRSDAEEKTLAGQVVLTKSNGRTTTAQGASVDRGSAR